MTPKKKHTIIVQMDPKLAKGLKALAAAQDRSLSAQVRIIIAQAVEREGGK